jgi:hypothetical protein
MMGTFAVPGGVLPQRFIIHRTALSQLDSFSFRIKSGSGSE